MISILRSVLAKTIGRLIESSGIKRKLVTWLAFVLDVTRLIPGAEQAVLLLDQINGTLGIGAVGHAAGSNTLSKEKIAGVVAVLYGLIALSIWIPALAPALPFLYKAAGTLAAARLGLALAK